MTTNLLIYFRIKKVTLVVRGGGRGLARRVEDTQGFPQVYGFDSLSTIAAVVHMRTLIFCLRAKPCALFCLHVQGQQGCERSGRHQEELQTPSVGLPARYGALTTIRNAHCSLPGTAHRPKRRHCKRRIRYVKCAHCTNLCRPSHH